MGTGLNYLLDFLMFSETVIFRVNQRYFLTLGIGNSRLKKDLFKKKKVWVSLLIAYFTIALTVLYFVSDLSLFDFLK